MRINTNVSALNAQRQLGITNQSVSQSITRLSSGFRINRAADDAAGLGIANKLRGDIRSMSQAARNGEQANSLAQIAEGAVSSVSSMLDRMKELATQANSDTVDDAGRSRLQEEFSALRDEIARTANTTQFGSTKLLDGRLGGVDIDADDLTSLVALDGGALVADASDVTIGSDVSVGTYTLTVEATDDTDLDVTLTDQDGNVIGTDSITVDNATQDIDGDQTMTFGAGDSAVSINIADTADLGAFDGESFEITGGGGDFMVGSSGAYATGGTTGDLLNFESVNLTTNGSGLDIDTLDLNSAANAQTALTSIDSAISTVNEAVGSIGAFQNRIENAVANLKTAIENLSASESVIRDLDMAEEMTSFTKNQILQQAGTAMLAQANQSSQSVLQLLGG